MGPREHGVMVTSSAIPLRVGLEGVTAKPRAGGDSNGYIPGKFQTIMSFLEHGDLDSLEQIVGPTRTQFKRTFLLRCHSIFKLLTAVLSLETS